MDKLIAHKVRITLKNIEKLITSSLQVMDGWKYIPCEYKTGNSLPVVDETWSDFSFNDKLVGKDKHFWFYNEIKTPAVPDGEEICFKLTTGHEGEWLGTNVQSILYLNGEMVQGLDVNHTRVVLKPDTEYKIHMYFHIGGKNEMSDMKTHIEVRNTLVQKLYYDIKVPYEAALCFEETDYAFIRTLRHLDAACNLLDFSHEYTLKGDESNATTTGMGVANPSYGRSEEFYNSAVAAVEYLKKEYFEKECGCCDAIVNYIGHTHIDVAWLWTLATTKEKTQHSFVTVLALMDRYPQYKFMSSQPQLYQYLKEEAPEVYEKVKQKIKEGRWEVEGAMWLEADCNLSSGESLIRQVLQGKQFMKDEFGVDSRVLWLPDVFGYSAAMPQILRKSGVDKFVTSKISWNDTNRMPYDTFYWQGVDGTEIFTYFITSQDFSVGQKPITQCRYNGTCDPKMALGAWERYQQKDLNDEVIVSFGYGDGGGGPTEEMLEYESRLEYGLPGMPKAQMGFAGDFLNRVEENIKKAAAENKRVPKWVGELYLEFHRGTYTCMANTKKNNRQCEFLCQTAETLSVMDKLFFGSEYPQQMLYDNWRVLLLNQFHDILPGSSIRDVYTESDAQYDKVRADVGAVQNEKIQKLASEMSANGIMVYNPNSFEASSYVEADGKVIYAKDIPALGWKVIEAQPVVNDVVVSDRVMENKYYKVSFNENYEIVSIYDKENKREVIKENEAANLLKVYEDYPINFDNWEISSYFRDKTEYISNVENVKVINENGMGGFEIVRRYGKSLFNQKIVIYTENRRIDFINNIDWHENHKVVRALFPLDIHSSKATYEIQFGNVERNTHENTAWDEAQFEVCAQKWIDFSEKGYGVSMINDCKYGYYVDENVMSITFFKCGVYPNPEADQGMHNFTYSLIPHAGDFTQSGTIKEAYLLNRPMLTAKCDGNGSLPAEYSFVNCDSDNIIIETVKQAENGKGIIVRLYDSWGGKSVPTLKFGFDVKKVSLCDMMENVIEEIGNGNEVSVKVNNFEIITLLVEV